MRIAIVLLLTTATALSTSKTPQFGDYAVNVLPGSAAPPKLSRKTDAYPDSDPHFRQALETALKHGPNFAGRYLVVAWTCGSGCSNFIVMDTATGVLYRRTPFYTLFVGGQVGNGSEYSGLSFQRNSRLLIAEGCFGEHGGCWRRFYIWTGTKFKLLQQLRLTRQ